MNKYINYHKHDHVSNIFTPDVNVKPIDYVNRILELGYDTYFTINHGSGGNIFDSREVCDENNINCKFGIEGYIVPNALEKDARNYHIILIPKTNIARKKLNLASSHANEEGYYYKPRFFMSDLLDNFNDDDLYITTACVQGLLKDDDSINQIFLPLYEKYGKNIMLEVQNHDVDIQKSINEKAIKYHKELGLYLIAANDSHYIYPNQAKERLELLKGKGINYGDEDTFILDYPDYNTFAERFKNQGLLSDNEIIDAIDRTLIFEECENIDINKNIKMPTIYPNLSNDEKITLLKKEVNDNFKIIMKEENVSKEMRKKYVEECRKEMQVIEDTNDEIHTADYFLLNKQVYDLASGKYHGTLTKTGRGSCFTKTALVLTKEGYKTIDNVKIGDEVISDDCKWHKVINTMSFDVCEPLIEFTHYKQGSVYKKYKNQCTLDHKLLVNRDGDINYIEAKDIIVGDLLCSPKIKNKYNDEFKEVIDLNDYNIFGYDYDDNYIYEKVFIANRGYKYSPKWFEKNGYAINPTFAKNVINGWRPKSDNPRTKKNVEELLKVTNFKSLDDYENYCKYKCIKTMPIKRFVKNDMFFNCIIGMMYGDGWTQKDYAIGFAVNNDSKMINRKLFIKFANMLGHSYENMYENVAKDKNLQQLFINSHILNNFWKTNFFASKKGNEKLFNQKLFNQPQQNLKGLLYGLKITDGSKNIVANKMCYDSTSMSLIGAYSALDNIVNHYMPSALDVRLSHVDKRNPNWVNKESYKIRRTIVKTNKYHIEEDNNYWFLPIESINIIPKHKNTVYDLTIEDRHSYVINNIIVHNCGSFILNKMLGMTQIDRLRSDLPLYSERFISTARLLENHSMADYDFNCATQEPFIKATRELLGEHQCYPMLAYGTMKESEAFRNVCRSYGLEFAEFNEVGKNIDQYRNDSYWGKYIDEAQTYISTVISCSVHPCSFLLMNEDIREELGVLKIGDVLCAPITSSEADNWKYLKNDYLIVTVWDIIKQTFDLIGRPIISIRELENNLDDKVWELFDKGLTATLNQVDGDWATSLIKQYKPRSVSEMAKFVACIRPSFETMRDDFISRKPYTTGFENIDNLFKSTDCRVLFQENVMQYFEWLGITPSESIGLIKKISKKKIKPKDFEALKDRMKKAWLNYGGTEEEFEISFQDMQSQMKYSFNSPHGLAYAYDCLYCAYLKSHYPLEYYTVVLNIYKDDVEKSNRLCKEMEYFGIKLSNTKFGYNCGEYSFDRDTNTIYKSLASIKNIGKDVGNKLDDIKDFNFTNFIDVLSTIDNNKICNARELTILISINFFERFGNPNQLLKVVDIYNKFISAKQLSKDKLTQREMQIVHQYAKKETPKQFKELDNLGIIYALVDEIKDTTSILEQISYDLQYLGYTTLTYNCNYFGVEAIELNKYGTPYLKLYRISTGESMVYKVDKKWYNQFTTEYHGELKQGDILDITLQEKPKRRKVDDEWVEVGSELVITAFCRV